MIFRLPKGTELTAPMIERYLEKNRPESARRAKLWDYYLGNHAIKNRTFNDESHVNNKVANPYPHYITTMFTGFFMGKPVQYKSADESMMEVFDGITSFNDDASENAELAKDASICGVAYELLYLDTEKNIRYKRLDPTNCIPIYDSGVEGDLLYFIRYYDDEDILTGHKITWVEVYDSTAVYIYRKDVGSLQLYEKRPHNFGDVPISVYENNSDGQGDFEIVLPLVDAYDKAVSDSVNEQEYSVDAFLALYGALGTTEEDLANMRKNRVLLLDTDCKAEWLTKNVNDTESQNLKTTLQTNIFQFSECPNLTDEHFASVDSGIALRYKLIGFENATAKKEGSFKKGLQRRFELICNMLALMGSVYDYRNMEIVFQRNLPENISETADLLQKVGYLLSKETQMSLLPLDIDVQAEKERLKAEHEEFYDDGWGDIGELLGRQSEAE